MRISTAIALLFAGVASAAPAPPQHQAGKPKILSLDAAVTIGRKLNPIMLEDGRTIIFSGLVAGNWDLFVRAPDGTVRRWASDRLWEGSPSVWRRTGRIAFERFDRQRGAATMWSARIDGSDERRLSEHGGFR